MNEEKLKYKYKMDCEMGLIEETLDILDKIENADSVDLCIRLYNKDDKNYELSEVLDLMTAKEVQEEALYILLKDKERRMRIACRRIQETWKKLKEIQE